MQYTVSLVHVCPCKSSKEKKLQPGNGAASSIALSWSFKLCDFDPACNTTTTNTYTIDDSSMLR